MRTTGPDFNTASFGHATSGIACAAVPWHELTREFGDQQWVEPLCRALNFCRTVQFTRTEDPNPQGAILEKVLPPDGADKPPRYLRDVGIFLCVQALSMVLRDARKLIRI